MKIDGKQFLTALAGGLATWAIITYVLPKLINGAADTSGE